MFIEEGFQPSDNVNHAFTSLLRDFDKKLKVNGLPGETINIVDIKKNTSRKSY